MKVYYRVESCDRRNTEGWLGSWWGTPDRRRNDRELPKLSLRDAKKGLEEARQNYPPTEYRLRFRVVRITDLGDVVGVHVLNL